MCGAKHACTVYLEMSICNEDNIAKRLKSIFGAHFVILGLAGIFRFYQVIFSISNKIKYL